MNNVREIVQAAMRNRATRCSYREGALERICADLEHIADKRILLSEIELRMHIEEEPHA